MRRDWTKARIRYALDEAGVTVLSDLDRKHDLPPGTIATAMSRPHREGERIISNLLKRPASLIWPSRFDTQGNRLSPQPVENYKPNEGHGHCHKASAA